MKPSALAKCRVLKKHPKARECITWPDGGVFIVIGLGTILGQGANAGAAWRAAARRMERK